MVFARLLIKPEAGRSEEVLKKLRELGIKADMYYGSIDIMADIETETQEAIAAIVSDKIRLIEGIEKTETCIRVESSNP